MHPCTHCPQAAHATLEESDENFALEYGLLSPREEGSHPVGAYGDYGLGDNSDLPPGGTRGAAGGGGGAVGGGPDDEDLYGEYGDAYGGDYGDPYGAPLGELDGSALPSPSTTAAEPRRAMTQGPPPTRALSHAAPPKPSLSERVAAADARLGAHLSPPSAALVEATAGDVQPMQPMDPAVVADMRAAFDLVDANGNGVPNPKPDPDPDPNPDPNPDPDPDPNPNPCCRRCYRVPS